MSSEGGVSSTSGSQLVSRKEAEEDDDEDEDDDEEREEEDAAEEDEGEEDPTWGSGRGMLALELEEEEEEGGASMPAHEHTRSIQNTPTSCMKGKRGVWSKAPEACPPPLRPFLFFSAFCSTLVSGSQ